MSTPIRTLSAADADAAALWSLTLDWLHALAASALGMARRLPKSTDKDTRLRLLAAADAFGSAGKCLPNPLSPRISSEAAKRCYVYAITGCQTLAAACQGGGVDDVHAVARVTGTEAVARLVLAVIDEHLRRTMRTRHAVDADLRRFVDSQFTVLAGMDTRPACGVA